MAANKKRISQISKETGVQNRVLVEKAQEIGLLVKSHSSSVGPGENVVFLNIKC
ncbi:translation initiation factor IF-2 N-terminal domain-containing protein [Lactococcus cremoris]